MVIGDGTNLIVSDGGFRGIVLRIAPGAWRRRARRFTADAGAGLQDLVDFTIARGLKGLETLSGIPGCGRRGVRQRRRLRPLHLRARGPGAVLRRVDGLRFDPRSLPVSTTARASSRRRKEWIISHGELVLDSCGRLRYCAGRGGC